MSMIKQRRKCYKSRKYARKEVCIKNIGYLEEGGGDGNAEGGGGPEESAESNDMGTVVTKS